MPDNNSSDDDYPVVINEDGIKIKTERMEQEKLYHCVFEDKVYLFYKDELGLLHCYEVENPEAVKEITKNPGDIENILKKHAGI
ncbi:hypothetical protein [Candidatus Nitrososphaera evergladensis]|uniref:hypothetical protein n=1 Tax=Candidatus Nitrososphaera evergladensis TaxID=1459637 RepID=UPI0011E5CD9F|nr:hypothetical protein [Candidatus Nitrososphaera evergladensis]